MTAYRTIAANVCRLLFIYLFIQFINQEWHRSTSKEHTGRMANTWLTNHLCAANKKINRSIHKTLEINYNFPSKVYEKSEVRSIDLNTDKLFSWTRAGGIGDSILR